MKEDGFSPLYVVVMVAYLVDISSDSSSIEILVKRINNNNISIMIK